MKFFKSSNLLLATAFSTFLLITGCSSGGGGGVDPNDGGDGGSGTAVPALPTDSVVITDANAMSVADSAVSAIGIVDAMRDVMAVNASSVPSMKQIIALVKNKVFDRERRSYQPATGVTGTDYCTSGGSVSYNYTETATSFSGSATFNNCNEGIVINGSVSFTSSWNNSTYDYTDTLNGTLTYTYGPDTFTMVLDLNDSGNESSGDYEETITFSISGIPGANFLMTTEQAIVGNYFSGSVYSGQLLIEGANNTRLRITITSTNYARVDLDNGSGSFSTVDYIDLTYY